MSYHETISTCRFCGKSNYDRARFEMIKYGVRHYAHPDCALAKQGVAFLERLNLWQLAQFPYRAALESGLLADLERLYSTRAAEHAEHEARLRGSTP